MNQFHMLYHLMLADYRQRVRSYSFWVMLLGMIFFTYLFVPRLDASMYIALNLGGYRPVYNSAWIGYVTAIMTSIFLSLIGFYLVNSGIKTDSYTRVGQIISSTSISNFKYLLAKMLSNFFVLLTIVLTILIMSIALFFLYNRHTIS